MKPDRARTAAIIETVPCDTCGAMPGQPCVTTTTKGRQRPWLASVHFIRRDRARRWQKENEDQWRRTIRMALELTDLEHEEYLKQGGRLANR